MKRAMLCSGCNQWILKAGEAFCGHCGLMFMELGPLPEKIELVSGVMNSGGVTLKNETAHEITVSVNAEKFPSCLKYDCGKQFQLASYEKKSVSIHLDEAFVPDAGLPFESVLIFSVNNNMFKTRSVTVVLKAGPRPNFFPALVDFGEFPENSGLITQNAAIKNTGGWPLVIKNIKPADGSPLNIADSLRFPVEIAPQKELVIGILWDSGMDRTYGKAERTGLDFHFKGFERPLFMEAKGKVVRKSLAARPEQISIAQVIPKRPVTAVVRLFNTGNSDITIKEIISDASWIFPAAPEKAATLLCLDSIESGVRPDSKNFFEFLDISVAIKPESLPEGTSNASIEIVEEKASYRLSVPVSVTVVFPEPCPHFIGIDFGTTNSVVAVYDPDSGEAVCISPEEGGGPSDALIPSVLVFRGNPENYVIGREAVSDAVVHPEFSVRSIKRIMGTKTQWPFFGRLFTPEELTSLIITRLLEYAEDAQAKMSGVRCNMEKAIVTVPVRFEHQEISAILQACECCGVNTRQDLAAQLDSLLKTRLGIEARTGIVLDEPSAAAFYYLPKLARRDRCFLDGLKDDEKCNFVVIDYGGGTLDVAVISVRRLPQGGLFIETLGHDGDNDIGGDSIDIAILKRIVTECKNANPEMDSLLISENYYSIQKRRDVGGWDRTGAWSAVLAARAAWKEAAERVKIALSEKGQADFHVNGSHILKIEGNHPVAVGGGGFTYRVFPEVLEGWIGDILMKVENVIRNTLFLSGKSPDGIHYILHTGRSSLLSCVRRRVREIFSNVPPGNDILEEDELKFCVAKGAVMYGAQFTGTTHVNRGIYLSKARGRKLPCGYGVGAYDPLVGEVYVPIVPINSTCPEKYSQKFEDMILSDTRIIKFYRSSASRENEGSGMLIRGNNKLKHIATVSVANGNNTEDGNILTIEFDIDENKMYTVCVNGKSIPLEPERYEDVDRWMA